MAQKLLRKIIGYDALELNQQFAVSIPDKALRKILKI